MKCSRFSPISTALPKPSTRTCLKVGCKVKISDCLQKIDALLHLCKRRCIVQRKCWLVKSLTFTTGVQACNLPPSASKMGKFGFGCQSHSRNSLGFAKLVNGLHFLVRSLPAL